MISKYFAQSVSKDNIINSIKLHDDCSCHEVCYCLSGSIEIKVENEIHRLSADDVILFDGSLEHECIAITEAEYLVLHLPKETLNFESLLESVSL